ncbi:MAG TPA: hypothetical protein DCW51_07380 [Clostridium sp.]|nr:hypothetical protein [Clostridium sp.]
MKDSLAKIKNLIIRRKKVVVVLIFMICIIGGYFIYDNIRINNAIQRNREQINNDKKNRELKEEFNKITDDYKKESKAETDKLNDDINNLSLLTYDEKEISHSNGYYEIQVTVENYNEKDVTYSKINLNFKDENNKIIQSKTIIDTNVIKYKAKQTLTTKIPDTVKYKTIDSEVVNVRY